VSSISLESFYKKVAAPLKPSDAGEIESSLKPTPVRHISPAVAHELNNVLTVIQGSADGLMLKHGENPAIKPLLRLIAEGARRATLIVREATPRS
jgi:nitrogen-specific signal transduction histidine kinase